MTGFLSHLPVLEAERRIGRPQPKTASRLQIDTAAKKLETITDSQYRQQVYELDKGICRKCGASVKKTRDRIPRRAEVHHAHGRTGALRHDVRGGILVCLSCHEKLTGKVAEKWVIVATTGSTTFTVKEKGLPREYLSMRGPIKFERVA